VPGKNTGTVSNTQGTFHLEIPETLLNDSFVLSCVGYRTIELPLSEIIHQNNLTIKMHDETIDIQEVTVSTKRLKKQKNGTVGRTPLVMTPSESLSNFDIIEHAQLVEINSLTKISNANIYLVASAEDSLMLRLNFYNAEEGRPGNTHVAKSIVKNFKAEKGWLRFDFEDTPIYLANDFYFSFEYLPKPTTKKIKNIRVFFGSRVGGGNGYMRKCSQCSWTQNKGF